MLEKYSNDYKVTSCDLTDSKQKSMLIHTWYKTITLMKMLMILNFRLMMMMTMILTFTTSGLKIYHV